RFSRDWSSDVCSSDLNFDCVTNDYSVSIVRCGQHGSGRIAVARVSQHNVHEGTFMTTTSQLPFRADHVGSLLRPKFLLEAREARSEERRVGKGGRAPW